MTSPDPDPGPDAPASIPPPPTPPRTLSRRLLMGSALVTAGAAGGVLVGSRLAPAIESVAAVGPATPVTPTAGSAAASPVSTLAMVEPFSGARQSGIVTAAQGYAMFIALDLADPSRESLARLLAGLTEVGSAITQGATVPERPARPGLPAGLSAHTDFATGLGPARLTMTVGLGPRVFDLPGLAEHRPRRLNPIPAFPGDALDPGVSDGDVLVQLCADDQQVVSHAARSLRGRLPGLARLRWTQTGFLGRPADGGTPRNMFGQKDGTANPAPGTTAFDVAVWARGDEPAWFAGNGTYLVFRKIRLRTADWDLTPVAEQDQVIGRFRGSGAPLTGTAEFDEPDLDAHTADGAPVIAADAHLRVVRGVPMLRRGYNYDYGFLPAAEHTHSGAEGGDHTHTGAAGGAHGNHDRLDAGLLFCCYLADPAEFVRAQTAMAAGDRLSRFLVPTASALFAMLPGATAGASLGAGLTSV